MLNRFFRHPVGKWLVVAALLLGFGFAMAQSEPTLNQVYEAAQAGRLEQAQVMMQQVLVAHPNSAKAHFVQAELSARQGQLSRAREALATAERLAPGLPFAKPQAVQALRSQLAAKSSLPIAKEPATRVVGAGAPAAPSSPFPWGIGLALVGGAIAIGIFLMRKKPTAAPVAQATYSNQGPLQGGLNGPQSFGMGGAMPPASGQPGYGQPGYGQPGYGQPAGSGIGGKVVGGLATGLALGAGVMAAQAIGKNLMGNNEHPAHQPDSAANNGYEPIASNNDLGGQNFGVDDASAWDDGNASASSGGGDDGGGDWDT